MPGSGCRFIHGRGAEAKRNWGPGRSPAPALQLDLFCSGSGHRGACAQLYYTRVAQGAGGQAGGMVMVASFSLPAAKGKQKRTGVTAISAAATA
jgi:hypothetical protein